MPQKAGVLVFASICALASATAAAAQSRGEMLVSAYVTVSSSIATVLGASEQSQTSSTPAPAAQTSGARQICATVAVSCSGDAMLRVNADGADDPAAGGKCASNSGGRRNFGLCASAPAQ